jgi:hypothetical protein
MISKECQYRKNESEDQCPIIFTTSGGTCKIKSSVVPPIQKLWPEDEGRLLSLQMLLQHSSSFEWIRNQMPNAVMYENIGRPSLTALTER